ncbi:MAG TPA: Cro/Cl family transcriptional regulator [Ruminococcaceae bacterium]|nr:Cro/Cl family transcriptional regulator [Oscillospiraceae bacterium]
MAVSYNRLWKLLIDKNLKKTELKQLSGISSNVLAKLGKNEPVAVESLEKVCLSLDCKIEDIMEFVSEVDQ